MEERIQLHPPQIDHPAATRTGAPIAALRPPPSALRPPPSALRPPSLPEPSSVSIAEPDLADRPFWFCVRTHPRHEHIATAHLRERQLEVFCPRLRQKRGTRRGPVWMVEALFPGYIFARFALRHHLDTITTTPSVSTLVRFGAHWPVVPTAQIEGLREAMEGEEVAELPPAFEPGDEVQIAGGPFHGLQAVVKHYLPSRERVRVLLDFLGRMTEAEMGTDQLRPRRKHPRELAIDHDDDPHRARDAI